MNTQLKVVRDQRLEPIQGKPLADVVSMPTKKWKPSTVVFMFMAIGGIVAFAIGFFSI